MRSVSLALLGLVAVTARASAAEPPLPGTLTLADCVRLAEAAPSSAQVADRQRTIARARADYARAGLLPRLAFTVNYTRNSPLPGAGPEAGRFVSLNGVNQYTALVALSEEVDLSGKLRAGRGRAHADEAAAEASYRLSRRDLQRAVTAAYHRLLLARRLAAVGADTFAESERFAARTELLTKKGEAARADVVRAASQVAFLRQARQAAELESALANQELASFWTEDVATPLAIVDLLDQPIPTPPALNASSAQARPELALLDAQRRGLEADARAAHASRYPQGNVTAEYGVDANRIDWRDRGYAVLLGLTVPIFDWAAAANSARALSLQAQQITTEAQMSRRAFSREYQSALARVNALYEQIATTREQVRLSEENLKLSRIRYEGGEGSALEVVTAQTQIADARTNYYQAIVGHLNARADLAIASGQ